MSSSSSTESAETKSTQKGSGERLSKFYENSAQGIIDTTQKNVSETCEACEKLQKDAIQSAATIAKGLVEVQKNFMEQMWPWNPSLPDGSQKVVQNVVENYSKALETTKQASMSLVEASRQTLQSQTETSKTYSEISKGLWEAWQKMWQIGTLPGFGTQGTK